MTLPLIESTFITKCQSPSLSALRTERRWWDHFFLSVEYGRDLRIKLHVPIGDRKFCTALPTCTGLDDFFVHREKDKKYFSSIYKNPRFATGIRIFLKRRKPLKNDEIRVRIEYRSEAYYPVR